MDALDGIRGNSLMIDVSQGQFAYATPGNPASGLAPNPNFLRPFVGSRGSFNDRSRENETLRATAYFRHDFTERSQGIIGKLLGRHTLTAVAFQYIEDRHFLSGNTAFMDYDDLRAIGLSDAQSRAGANSLGRLIYLGDSLAGRDTTTGLNIPRYTGNASYPDQVSLNYIHSPSGEIRTGTVGVHHVDNEPLDRLATGASLARDSLDTMAAVLQSHWWDGALVTTYGLRRDKVKQYNSTPFPQRTDFTRIFDREALGTSSVPPNNEGERDTITYSGVLKVNRVIGRWMPRGEEPFVARPGLEYAPSLRKPVKVERKEDFLCLGRVRPVKPTGDESRAPEDCARVHRERHRQRWQRIERDARPIPTREQDVGEVGSCISSADQEHALLHSEGQTVSGRARQSARDLPSSARILEYEHGVVPGFRSAFPRAPVREVRATRDDQRAVAHAGEAAGKPFVVGQRGELLPCEDFARGLGVRGQCEADQERRNRLHFESPGNTAGVIRLIASVS